MREATYIQAHEYCVIEHPCAPNLTRSERRTTCPLPS